MSTKHTSHPALQRTVGLPGAVLLGLGSMLGTGVYVTVPWAAQLGGSLVLLAVLLAAGVALCNGLSSATLARVHPVAGGTYTYAHKFVHPWAGYLAGWLFLSAKSASAAAAALALVELIFPGGHPWLALLVVAVMLAIVLSGLRRSNQVNAALVGLALLGLVAYSGASGALGEALTWPRLEMASTNASSPSLFFLTAILFVAYTGYGRIATMGEEITAPGRNIPRAILWTVGATLALYLLVAGSALQIPRGLASAAEPAESSVIGLAQQLLPAPGGWIMWLGALAALGGVLLNLLLGLSRVWLAMGRHGDLPPGLAQLDPQGEPRAAILAAALGIGLVILPGGFALAWEFSAFTVLLYYGLTNFTCLRLPEKLRPKAPWFAWIGLIACGFLAWWVPWPVWVFGLVWLGLGAALRWGWQRYQATAE